MAKTCMPAREPGSRQSLTVENYIKIIYTICAEVASGVASTGELARRLALTPGTITSMLQRLGDAGLVSYRAHQGVRLTKRGADLALRVLRRHRLIELFLVRTLNVPWDEVHGEAERMEHAVSDRLIDRIDEQLGFPERDPHGDPIPGVDGRLRAEPGEPLSDCPPGTRFVLLRVPDTSAEFLRYLSEGGLQVGARAEIVENLPEVGVVSLQADKRRISIGQPMARELRVRRTH